MPIENFNEELKLYQATVMLLSGRPQRHIDAIFFHTRSFGDDTGLLELASEKYKAGETDFIEVTNNDGERDGSTTKYEANPGRNYYKDRLRILGVPRNRISIPRTRAYHTRQENTAIIKQAQYKGWTSGVILTQPHQLVRAMLGAVQAMKEVGYQIELYTLTPVAALWLEKVKGNQGAELKPRIEHIEDELIRIHRYQASGELATFDQLFDYLKARDEGRLILGPFKRGSERFIGDLLQAPR